MSRTLLSIRHLEVPEIESLLQLSKEHKARVLNGTPPAPAAQRTIGLLFFENSTRTRVSFEQAANYSGYRVSNFIAEASSLSKGETLKDTIRTLRSERLDAVVIRHKSSGSAQLAAQFFGGPVINAGDGEHEHPTQALADALTILEHKGRIDGLKIAIVGDVLHSRVARSNAWLLEKMGADVRLVGPPNLLPAETGKLPGEFYQSLLPAMQDADVVMCLRLQKERMMEGLLASVGQYRRGYQVNRETLMVAKDDCIVMHPGPLNRGVELDDFAADGPQSVIGEQVENGIFVRMAALSWVFGESLAPAKAKAAKVNA